MDGQEILALGLVALTTVVMGWRWLRVTRRKSAGGGGCACGCPAGTDPRRSGQMVYRARKNERAKWGSGAPQ